ncbi:hypothetical protein PR202_ga10342 [Eleusine coracana subsp. coracana]|uniref:Reverse transcriptase zinc-binding domain-containing protein n=1 Tax=Eleusine coracana subsp. coracana TaxID=191504 RepID=A0AAV5C6F8_ELECO|nr:hypothetical protein PR202_ga10342 [Eleusine coracana subsp. coracana]
MKVKLFIWLAVWKRCWTADRLARRGLPHPVACPTCDQEAEDIRHTLSGCVFARKIWFNALRLIGLQELAPTRREPSFQEWWRRASARAPRDMRKGFNTMVLLVA